MGLVRVIALLSVGLFRLALSQDVSDSDIIHRDVCIIGGGSSGTYTAVRLSDLGQSVVVVEEKNVLGGHTNTYIDPTTKATWDYGVQFFHDLTLVTNYFDRLNVKLVNANVDTPPAGSQLYVDFNTGNAFNDFTPPNATDGLIAYSTQLERFTFLNGGFDLPKPVPRDLLLPFGDFVRKYGLDSMVFTTFSFGETLGVLLKQPTIYVMKRFGQDLLRLIFDNTFLTTAAYDNSLLYQSAAALLGDNVLFNSRVLNTTRSNNGVSVFVMTPSGQKLIKAKKLVIAIPQVPSNLVGFDLCEEEYSLFSKFTPVGYWTGLLSNTGIPANLTITNIDTHQPYSLPTLPGTFFFRPTSIPGIVDFKYGTPGAGNVPDADVKKAVVADLLRLRRAGLKTKIPDFVAFQSHNPFYSHVSSGDIRDGFYDRFNALQGQRSTWYTGASLVTQDSSLIWNFTESLLPHIVGGGHRV
ncbi:hypothetical protein APHAL10511_004717 [Amanita phalloides]|nr:hypothetical protein APHAL10511_004717 [Amanita phalloides]